jgi:hypothetical protein
MNCHEVAERLSDHLDGGLSTGEARAVGDHLAGCQGCARRRETLAKACSLLRAAPRLEAQGAVVSAVLSRLEVENRGPGLALLFRPAWAARPLIFPSLVPAAMVVISVLAGVLALGREPRTVRVVERSSARWDAHLAPLGTEANPLFPSAEVTSPQMHPRAPSQEQMLAQLREGSLFFETVVARDGSVSTVRMLDGDEAQADAVMAALRSERFEPARFRGRNVAASVLRLISRVEVSVEAAQPPAPAHAADRT